MAARIVPKWKPNPEENILARMPDQRRFPRAAAESIRSFLMLRLDLHLGLRQENLRQLLVCPRGHLPTSERRLTAAKFAGTTATEDGKS